MKQFGEILLFVLCGVLSEAGHAAHSGQRTEPGRADDRPNIVLIYVDDLGYGDLGAYGSRDIPTPHIDRLAAEGVRLTSSQITNPPCCPSRCSLIMGQYAQRFGKYGMSRGLPVPEDRPSLARFLRNCGYMTGQIGKWDIGTRVQGPLQLGFEEVARTPPKAPVSVADSGRRNGAAKSKYFCVDEAGQTVWLTDYDGDRVVEFVERHRERPFFLYWSPEAVHSPSAEVPERLMQRTTATGKRRKLAGNIVAVDDQVGKLLACLDRHALREKTLVIFSSDNGANGSDGGSSSPFTGGKGGGTQKEGWVRVPTILSMPGTIPEGTTYDGLVANFDFYSTAAAAAGQPIPDHCDGVNLLPYLQGKKNGSAHEYLFWLNNESGDAVRRHLMAVRWRDWRLYRKYAEDPWQLFDLNEDAAEEHDLAAANVKLVRQLSDRHAAWAGKLVPEAEIPQVSSRIPAVPSGHGWATAR